MSGGGEPGGKRTDSVPEMAERNRMRADSPERSEKWLSPGGLKTPEKEKKRQKWGKKTFSEKNQTLHGAELEPPVIPGKGIHAF